MPGSLPAAPCRWQGLAEGPVKSCDRSVPWSSAGSVKALATTLTHRLWVTCYPDTWLCPRLCDALTSNVFLLHREELEI